MREVKHLLEQAMARAEGESAGKQFAQDLDDLIARYGGKDNVPMEELQDLLADVGGMSEVAKTIPLTSAIMHLSEKFNLPFPETRTGNAMSLFINALLSDLKVYDKFEAMRNGPKKEVRRKMLELMIDMHDLTQGQIDRILFKPEDKAAFETWLDEEV